MCILWHSAELCGLG